MADRVGQQLGNYRLTKLLGRGGFADVYLGEHIHLGTLAAIKLLHLQLDPDEDNTKELEEFRAEARTLARLKHAHVVPILDFGIDNNEPFLVMEYAEQGSLHKRHPRGTRLPLATVVSYTKQIAETLQYAHDRRLIHRDIKPENIMVGDQGHLMVGDFGIAVQLQSSRSHVTASASGTATYMAPEQIEDQPRPASDQYALAIMVYEWLTGSPPFEGSQKEVLNKHLVVPPPSLRQKVSTIPLAVEQVVLKALAKDPKDRYPSVQAFASALEQASQPAGSSPSGEWGRQTPPTPDPAWGYATPTPDPAQGAYQPPHQPYQPPYQPYGAQVAGDPNAIPSTIKVPDTLSDPVSQKSTSGRGKRLLKTVLIGVGTIILIVVACNIWNAFTKIGPYTATVPGPGCDHGSADWSIADTKEASVSCSAAGMVLTWLTTSQHLAEVDFAESGHSFPQDYNITVNVSALSDSSCTGVFTHRQDKAGVYAFLVCSDGYWSIERSDNSSGKLTELSSGDGVASTIYHIKVIAQGNTEGIAINGGTLHTVSDSTYTDTNSVGFLLDSGSATFSNFVFTPL